MNDGVLQVIYVEKKKNKIIYAVNAQATKQIMNLTLRPTLHGSKVACGSVYQ